MTPQFIAAMKANGLSFEGARDGQEATFTVWHDPGAKFTGRGTTLEEAGRQACHAYVAAAKAAKAKPDQRS